MVVVVVLGQTASLRVVKKVVLVLEVVSLDQIVVIVST